MNIHLGHYDDGKEKLQSHEIRLYDEMRFNNEYGVFSHNVADLVGYGETKEEAIDDFKRKFTYVMNELRAFEKMLFETDIITGTIKEVNCLGEEID